MSGDGTLPSLIVECWCQPHDAVHARVTFGRLASQRDRDTVRRACKNKKLNVDL